MTKLIVQFLLKFQLIFINLCFPRTSSANVIGRKEEQVFSKDHPPPLKLLEKSENNHLSNRFVVYWSPIEMQKLSNAIVHQLKDSVEEIVSHPRPHRNSTIRLFDNQANDP